MLTFHFLNVGHGSSTVVEFCHGGTTSFGVIDSNLRPGDREPRALEKLRELGATSLSFVSMTHPHKDHYLGLSAIFEAFSVESFYSGPMGSLFQNRERLKKYAEKLLKVVNRTDGSSQRNAAYELVKIIRLATTRADSRQMEWLELAGDQATLAPSGFAGVEVATILPPAKVRGDYIQRIEKQDLEIVGTPKENDISLAFEFVYSGCKVVIGGDGTISNWSDRRRYERNRGQPIGAQIVNLPHHGSRHDCPPLVIDQLFGSGAKKIGVTSANGLSHPSPETIQYLETCGIKPYCTNLMPVCGANAQQLLTLPGLDPPIARWVREVANIGTMQTCQGDIRVSIEDDGTFEVEPQIRNLCGFRGEFAALMNI
ncbi:hypothetical protein [Bradyrhizobium sp.]|uniref:ComEC/Rec2 family competence protein n=1 Tax=Bradyrhizobium sp. TaxID=376 RepID=UPI00260EB045|nr:hypothetical protein [Bradyrhizobium sp.]